MLQWGMNLSQQIANYQTPEHAKQLARTTKITLLVGISGAGKDTIKRQLLGMSDYRDIVSHTTRPPRQNNAVLERDGVDYHFIDNSTVERMLAGEEFIEAKFVHGTVYGTSVDELQAAHDNQKIAITDIDVQGVDEYKKLASETVAIFILPPNYETWQTRLMQRYETQEAFDAEWPKRRSSAIAELTRALEVPYYHFIINDDLEEAVHTADQIAHQPDIFNRKDDEARLAARDLLDEIVKH